MLGRRQPPDPDAFAAEVLALLDPLYATALRLTRNRADAEDLVHDTLVKAFRFADRFERGTNLKAWLYTILHNTWRNRQRDAARDTLDADLRAALDALPDVFREAVWLRDVEEFTYGEIAQMLGVPIGTVMSR